MEPAMRQLFWDRYDADDSYPARPMIAKCAGHAGSRNMPDMSGRLLLMSSLPSLPDILSSTVEIIFAITARRLFAGGCEAVVMSGHSRWMGNGDEWGRMEDEWIRRGYYSSPFIPHSPLTMYNCRYLKQYNLISWQLRGIYMHTLPNKSQQKSQLSMFRLTLKWILRMNGRWMGMNGGWMDRTRILFIPHSSLFIRLGLNG